MYQPACARVLGPLAASADRAFAELAPVVRQLVTISEQQTELGTPAHLAQAMTARHYRCEYERLLPANGQAQLRYWQAVKRYEALEAKQQRQLDMLTMISEQLDMRLLNEAAVNACEYSTAACGTARRRKRNATPRQLCERRAACVGTVAAVAPPQVVVVNNAAQLCADQSGVAPPM